LGQVDQSVADQLQQLGRYSITEWHVPLWIETYLTDGPEHNAMLQ